MRTVWLIERAARPAAAPHYLAEGEDEVLRWTGDLEHALRFTEPQHAERFVHNRTTEPVCIVDKVVPC